MSFIWVSVTLNFAKCISDVIYLGMCDLEYCIAVLSMCSKRKMEWPQSPLTHHNVSIVVCLLYGKWKTTARFPFSIMLPVLKSDNGKLLTSQQLQYAWWTDWPKQPTFCVVINSHIENCILNFGQIVPLSESSCIFV